MRIRPFREADTERLVEVLAAVFAEYGMRFDPDGYDRDVREAARRYGHAAAAFFTAEEAAGRAMGFAGADLLRPGVAELHRLYVDPRARGGGLGRRLCEAVEGWARERGAREIELWSDVRFVHAHRMYAARGYRLFGQRTLADPDRSVEFGFRRPLDAPDAPVRHDAAAAAREPLPRILADPDRAHRAAMVTAAILDPRELVRAGRVSGGGHDLPRPTELFAPEALAGAVEAVLLPGAILVGFARGDEIRLHPLFAP